MNMIPKVCVQLTEDGMIPCDTDCNCSSQASSIASNLIGYYPNEHFIAIMLNTRKQVISVSEIAVGGIDTCYVQASLVFTPAILSNASAIIVAHNHPAGSLEPSKADLNCCKRLKESGDILGIKLVDFIIVSGVKYYSFTENKQIF